MIVEIQPLLDEYWKWLKDRTHLRESDDWIEITTPFLDRHNDYIQIYAKYQNEEIILTDDGYILADLEQSGYKINTENRQALLKTTINGFGVKTSDVNGGSLEIRASPENFALQKHNLVQAILAVNDLFLLSSPTRTNVFTETVLQWLEDLNIRNITNLKFTGQSGFDHRYDFVIPQSEKMPERAVRIINRPNRNAIQNTVFAWIDTKETRPIDSMAYAILNNSDQQIEENFTSALEQYNINPILWSDKDEKIEQFAG